MSAARTSDASRGAAQDKTGPSVTWGVVSASALFQKARRLEGEAYLMRGYDIRGRIEGGLKHDAVGALASVWQPSRLKGVTVPAAKGVPFITTNQVFDIRPAVRKWLAPTHVEDLENRYLKPGWILITCSGNGMDNVGKVFASYAAHQNIVVSHDLLRVVVNNPDHFGWVYAFLRSKLGRAMLRSNQYGSAIKHLEPEHVQALPVPVLDSAMVSDLNSRMRKVYRLRDDAFALQRDAEEEFASRIGAPPTPRPEPWFASSADALSRDARRLDAYHYNATATAVLQALKKTGRPIEALRKCVDRVFLPNRFTRVYGKQGIPFVDSEDIFKVNPDTPKRIPGEAKTDAAAYMVRPEWLLMARSGQIYGINGSVALATKWYEGKIVSEHVIRICTNKSLARSGYLAVALGHPVFGRPLVIRWAFGSGVPELAPKDIELVPVIRLEPRIESAIADRVERAAALRTEADDIEDGAVKSVEDYIERRIGPVEEKAPEWSASK